MKNIHRLILASLIAIFSFSSPATYALEAPRFGWNAATRMKWLKETITEIAHNENLSAAQTRKTLSEVLALCTKMEATEFKVALGILATTATIVGVIVLYPVLEPSIDALLIKLHLKSKPQETSPQEASTVIGFTDEEMQALQEYISKKIMIGAALGNGQPLQAVLQIPGN